MERLRAIVKALDDKKALDIQVLKVRDLTIIADYFVIATGTSSIHVRALADEIEYQLGQKGINPRNIEGRTTGWILLDYHDIVVHVFLQPERERYALEKLWGDAQNINLDDIK